MTPTVKSLLLARVLKRLERKRDENLDEAKKHDLGSVGRHVCRAYAEAFEEAAEDIGAEMGMEEKDGEPADSP